MSNYTRKMIHSVNQRMTHDEFLALYEKYKNGDMQAKQEIITRHLYLCDKVATMFCKGNAKNDYDDYVQEGYRGLEHALPKYNREVKTKFSTYAYSWVFLYIRQYHIKNHTIPVPIWLIDAKNRKNKENMSEKTKEKIEKYSNVNVVSMTMQKENSNGEMFDFEGNENTPLHNVMRNELQGILNSRIEKLSDIEKYVFDENITGNLSLREISENKGIPINEIRNVFTQVMKKLRN